MADDKPIIIVKKKGGHGGHHGGAWKVAYADFVTAMMAFFMVMWLVNSAETKVKKAIASYFRRPGLFETGSGTPLLMGGSGMLDSAFSPPKPDAKGGPGTGADREVETVEKQKGEGEKKGTKGMERSAALTPAASPSAAAQQQFTLPPLILSPGPNATPLGSDLKAKGIMKSDEDLKGVKIENEKQGGTMEIIEKIRQQKNNFEELAEELEEQIKKIPEFKEIIGLIEMHVDADGLTIEIMDTDKASMFRSGSAQINPATVEAFDKITQLLKPLPNQIDIMGHTDGKPFSSRGGMTNWELSADRANAARRLLEQQGIPAGRITSVVGRADRELRFPTEPFNPSNRRITLKVKFDLEQIKDSTEQLEAFREFGKLLPQPEQSAAPAAQPSGQAPQADAAAQPGQQAPPKPTIVPTKTPFQAYKPRIEIQAREKSNTQALPDEEPNRDTQIKKGDSQPTIFKNDPVIGPANPFFGY